MPGTGAERAQSLARLLRQHRSAAGMSQQSLAEAAGTSARLVSNLERAVGGVPRPGTLAALADALGLTGADRADILRGGALGDDPPRGRLPFGELLRRLREQAGLTQDELGARALVSPRTVSDLERGINRAPRQDTAALMARTLGLTGGNLLEFETAVVSAAEFAMIRSGRAAQDATVGAVPRPETALIGRTDELSALRTALTADAIVTVIGPAGVGKTRLAIEVLRELAHPSGPRTLFVPLSSARTTVDVVQILAVVLGRTLDDGLDSDATYEAAALRTLAAALSAEPTVLVLDNLEQVPEAQRLVATLAAQVQQCALVTTSRSALGIEGERVVALAPLAVPAVPADPDDVVRSPAVRLFVDRAVRAAPGWRLEAELADVAALCRALDGLPLALVLAAPAVRTTPVRAIAADLLSTPHRADAPRLPHRQRSLSAALAWSFNLLDTAARTLLCRLSVFGGAVDVETADLVCGSDGLDVSEAIRTLLTANMVFAATDADGEPVVRMLNAVTQFASERLHESGEADTVVRTLAEVMVRVAETAAPHLVGADQGIWQTRLTRHVDSFRRSLDWLLAVGEHPLAARLAAALWRYWYLAGRLREGRERTLAVLREIEGRVGLEKHAADIRYGLGVLTYMSGDVDTARELWLTSRADYVRMDDTDGVANAHNNLGMSYLYAGDLPAAHEHYERALVAARSSTSERPLAVTLGNLAKLLVDEGRAAEASPLVAQALDLFRELGDVRAEADLYGLLAEIARAAGDHDEARVRWEQALAGFEALRDPTGIAPILVSLAELGLADNVAGVRVRLDRALAIATETDDPWTSAHATVVLAQLTAAEGQRAAAMALLDRADELSAQCQHVEVSTRIAALREELANG